MKSNKIEDIDFKKRLDMLEEGRQIIVDVLYDWPQGLTSREIMKVTDFVSYGAVGTRLTSLRYGGFVGCLGEGTHHTYVYGHIHHMPYKTPTIRHLESLGKGNSIKTINSSAPFILQTLEQHPDGLSAKDLMEVVGMPKRNLNNMQYILDRFTGPLVEMISPESYKMADRVYRVIGSESEECQKYYQSDITLIELYRKYERHTIPVREGYISRKNYGEISRLIKDVEEIKDITPKELNMKIRFRDENDNFDSLTITNEGYTMFSEGVFTEYCIEELLEYIGRYNNE